MNLTELLTIPATMFPDRHILWFDGHEITYHTLADRVARTAAALRDLGMQPGDRVAVLQTSHPSTIEVCFGAAALGAVCVPLNYRVGIDELRAMLEVASPRVVLVSERYHRLAMGAADLSTAVVSLAAEASSGFAARVASADPIDSVEVEDDQLVLLMFTSGTTATAKAVMLSHDDLVNFVLATTEPASEEAIGTVLVAAPLYHIAGLSAILTATFAGRRIALMPQFDPGEWLHLVASLGVTHAFLVPTMLKRVLDQPSFSTTNLSSLSVLAYGAAPMPLNVIRSAIERFPSTVQFFNAFGQTETTSTVTMLGPDDHRLTGSPADAAVKLRRLGSIGRALPDVEIAIVDEHGNRRASGETGEIVIRTERTMRGYYRQPDTTRETLRDGWLHTRDQGWMDDDGYVYLTGRQSDLIIRGGENIAPQEVEAVLAAHPAVDDAAVFGLPDEEWGELVAAAVVPRAGAQVDPDELIDFCRLHLASYKKPSVIHVMDRLPRNDLGKLVRRELRARFTPTTPTATRA